MQNYTYIPTTEGMGAQYQRIICNYIYCKTFGYNFLYTPFKEIDHNYNKDPLYVEKIETLLNLKDNITNNFLVSTNVINFSIICKYFESNINKLCKSDNMKFIKDCFWKNKKRDYFKNNKINVAIHVRRPNPYDNRIDGTNTSDTYYLNIIKIIRDKYSNKELLFHIYSQGNPINFKLYESNDIILHINEDITPTFIGMVAAEILVTSASSLSYVAALISDGEIYYKKFWHAPKKKWIIYN